MVCIDCGRLARAIADVGWKVRRTWEPGRGSQARKQESNAVINDYI